MSVEICSESTAQSSLLLNPVIRLILYDKLYSEPDLTNSLLGVLLRFRKEYVAIMCDIEQMFLQFVVTESDRKYLQFTGFLIMI